MEVIIALSPVTCPSVQNMASVYQHCAVLGVDRGSNLWILVCECILIYFCLFSQLSKGIYGGNYVHGG